MRRLYKYAQNETYLLKPKLKNVKLEWNLNIRKNCMNDKIKILDYTSKHLRNNFYIQI